MKNIIFIFLLAIKLFSCKEPSKALAQTKEDNLSITCTKTSCFGTYKGPEFINGSDVAHQFSNEMSRIVGDKLKELYKDQRYSRVDFLNIKMTTLGMGSGQVVYSLSIPFTQVDNKCNAFTSFDHVGGWNHTPALSSRINQLQPLLLQGQELNISTLKTTKEGLQEYWIQWKHKKYQSECE